MLSRILVVAVTSMLASGLAAFAQSGPVDVFAGSSPSFEQTPSERADFNAGDWGVAQQVGAATYTYPICESAWKNDPLIGGIGVQF